MTRYWPVSTEGCAAVHAVGGCLGPCSLAAPTHARAFGAPPLPVIRTVHPLCRFLSSFCAAVLRSVALDRHAASVIPARWTRALKRAPAVQIVVLDKLDYCATLNNLSTVSDKPNFRFVKGSIQSLDLVAHVMQAEEIDTVMHFAAQVRHATPRTAIQTHTNADIQDIGVGAVRASLSTRSDGAISALHPGTGSPACCFVQWPPPASPRCTFCGVARRSACHRQCVPK
jgi:hypothetical protein